MSIPATDRLATVPPNVQKLFDATPLDMNLTNFPYVAYEVRFVSDDPYIFEMGAAVWRMRHLLMIKSWHRIPAASLPDDSKALQRLSGFLDQNIWRRNSVADILAGFYLGPGGHWYHPYILDRALDTWVLKLHSEFIREKDKSRKAVIALGGPAAVARIGQQPDISFEQYLAESYPETHERWGSLSKRLRRAGRKSG